MIGQGIGFGRLAATASAAIVLSAASSPVLADVSIQPYVSLRQVVNTQTNDNRGAMGWLEAGAGFEMLLDTNRVQGNVSYQYARRFEEFGDVSTLNRHNANANVLAEVIEDLFFVHAGGLATQYATDMRGFNAINNDESNDNQTQIFSAFIEPRVYQRLGTFATFDARYRLGAVTADGPQSSIFDLPGDIGLGPGNALGSQLTDSVTQSGDVRLASTRGTNTINWMLIGAFTHEDIDELDQKYRDYSAGGELGVRVFRQFEVLGSVGYEDIENTQDTILFDPLTGEPALDSNGRLQVDPAMPRRTAFATDGIYWNAGFRYTPSRRTALEVRGGRRYGASNFFFDFNHQSRSGLLIRANFQQTLNSFSRLLTQSINGVPFNVIRAGGIDQFAVPHCIIGIDPQSPGGECVGGLTQSLTPATFRSDNGTVSVSRRQDGLRWTVSGFYDRRRYVDAEQLQAPGQPQLPGDLYGHDESFGVRGSVVLTPGRLHTIGFDTMIARNNYALSLDRRDTLVMAGSTYTRRLNQKMFANGSLYGTHRFTGGGADSTSLTAAVGVRYNF